MSNTSLAVLPPKKRRGKKRESWTQRAKRLGVSTRTLDRWVEAGILDAPEYVRGRKYGDANEVPRLDQ
jgi:DNA-binding transcriptional MerR regulator